MSPDLKELLKRSGWFMAGLACAILFCVKMMLLFTDLPLPVAVKMISLIEGIILVYPCIYCFRKCTNYPTDFM